MIRLWMMKMHCWDLNSRRSIVSGEKCTSNNALLCVNEILCWKIHFLTHNEGARMATLFSISPENMKIHLRKWNVAFWTHFIDVDVLQLIDRDNNSISWVCWRWKFIISLNLFMLCNRKKDFHKLSHVMNLFSVDFG